MDRKTRQGLKTDKFAQDVFLGWDWLGEHRSEVLRYGAIALVIVAIGIGVLYYNRYQTGIREDALAQALHIDDATIGANAHAGAAPKN